MNQLETFVHGFEVLAVRLQKWAQSTDWDHVNKTFEYITQQWPKDIRQLSIELANRGWFIWVFDKSLTDSINAIKSIKEKGETEQDQYLEAYFEAHAIFIEEELSASYPERKELIKDAFDAHRAKLYGASITALLALSEGICRDNFPSIGLYSKHPKDKNKTKKPGIPKADDIFDKVPPLEILDEAILVPLRIKTSLTESIHHPNNEQHAMFNRHLIMHGLSKTYGHKTNSVKAIGLAFFVHKALHHVKQLAHNTALQSTPHTARRG